MAERKSVVTHGEDMDRYLSYLDGYRAILVLAGAGRVELFDKVNQSPDGVTAAKLAQANQWNEDATERLLNACVALKTLRKSTDENGKEIYQVSGTGCYMQKNSEVSVWEMTTLWTQRMYTATTGKLTDRLRGVELHDQSGNGHGQENLDRLKVVQREGFMKPYVKDLLRAFDLSRFKTVVDVGAGSGALTFELCRMYPSLSVTYFDKPEFTSLVKEQLLPKEEKLNISFMSGDYFKDELPAADLYIMPKNYYMWKPDQMPKLIKKVSEASNDGGGLLFIMKVMNDFKDGPPAAHCWDVIIMADTGIGRLRSGAEYAEMLNAAGYHKVEVAETSDRPPYDVLLATKS